jgi:hypothetical protein
MHNKNAVLNVCGGQPLAPTHLTGSDTQFCTLQSTSTSREVLLWRCIVIAAHHNQLIARHCTCSVILLSIWCNQLLGQHAAKVQTAIDNAHQPHLLFCAEPPPLLLPSPAPPSTSCLAEQQQQQQQQHCSHQQLLTAPQRTKAGPC